jgi:hypothetical protein
MFRCCTWTQGPQAFLFKDMLLKPLSIKVLVVIATLVAGAGPLRASRYEFLARHDGRRVAGARVCFSKATRSDDMAARWLKTAERRCFPADDVLDVPPGDWTFYTEKGSELVSSHPFRIYIPPGSNIETLHPLHVEMLPAATLDFSALKPALKEGEFFAVYISNDGQPLSAAAMRVVGAEAALLVPAGMRIVPLIAREGKIVRAGNDLELKKGETVRLTEIRAPLADRADVIVQVTIANQDITTGSAPAVQLLAENEAVVATERLRSAPLFHNTLVFFRNVPAQHYSAQLFGDGWRSAEVAVSVSLPAAEPFSAGPLVATEGAALALKWSIDPAFSEPAPPGCETAAVEDEEEPPARPELSIRRCTPDQLQRLERWGASACTAVLTRRLDAKRLSGSDIIAGLPSGEYVTQLKFGNHSIHEVLRWNATQDARQAIHLTAGFVMGRVTKEGQPVQATLEFPGGTTVSDPATGAYRILMSRAIPRPTLIAVTPCGSARRYVHRTSAPLVPGSTHDIDIPSGGIIVTATSRADGKPIAGASGSIAEDEVEFPVYEVELPPTDEEGRTTAEPVIRDTPLQVCLYAKGFTRACRGGITVGNESVQVALQLAPKAPGVAGRVMSNQPVQPGARMYLVQNGTRLAAAIVDQEKRFSFDAVPPAATLVFIDKAHGLAIIGAPAYDEEGTLIATVPDVAPASFQVLVSERFRRRSSQPTLQIGNVLIPVEVFWHHQGLTGGPTSAIPGVPFAVTAILPTAPLHVILGYEQGSQPPDVQNPFARPDLVAAMPRKQVQGSLVTFD